MFWYFATRTKNCGRCRSCGYYYMYHRTARRNYSRYQTTPTSSSSNSSSSSSSSSRNSQSHSVICHLQWPAKQTGTRFTYPGGMEGQVDLGGWLDTYMPRWFTCSKTVSHPGTNRTRRRATLSIKTNALTARPSCRTRANIMCGRPPVLTITPPLIFRAKRSDTGYRCPSCLWFSFFRVRATYGTDRQTDGRARPVMWPITTAHNSTQINS